MLSWIKYGSKLQLELSRSFSLLSVRVERVLKVSDLAIVCKGRFRGEPVIFKKFLGPKSADIVTRSAAELQYLEANLKPPFFANRCIATAPAIGVIVLSHVPGQRLRQAWVNASVSGRQEIVCRAGEWLGSCVDLRSQDRALRPRQIVGKLQTLASQCLDDTDRETIEKMLAELHGLARRLEGRQVSHTIAHDDLTLSNLHYCAGEIHAIDIQGGHHIPIIRSAARFLVMKDLFRPPSRSDLLYGLDAADAYLFMKAAKVAVSRKRVVKFFFGEQMLQIFLSRLTGDASREHARQRMHAFLAHAPTSKVSEFLK